MEGFNLVIVGAGAAGCVLARRLAERGDRSILLLEAGPDLRSATPPMLRDGWRLPSGLDWPDWGFESTAVSGGSPAKLRRGRLMGGTSWLTRFAVRGAAADFDAWAAAGNPGWLYADILPAFQRLESDAEFGGAPGHGGAGPIPITRYPERHVIEIHARAVEALAALGHPLVEDVNGPAAVGVGRMPMSSRDGERVTALDAYLPGGWSSPQLTVRPDASVDRVLIEAGRARGVRLTDGSEVSADEVIVSAGVYGSPAILMRSGIGAADHLRALVIPVIADLPGVGANLADHPAVELDSGSRGAPGRPSLHTIATYRSAQAPTTGGPDLMFWLQDPTAEDPALWLDPILLRPRSRGSVRLRSADPSDTPIIELPGLRNPADVERLVEGYLHGVEVAGRLAPKTSAVSAAEARRIVSENVYSIPHTVGTCAMGPSPADGAVVDGRGRVHGIDSLSVIDASIMPDPPSGFPHLITIMLAEHLASMRALSGSVMVDIGSALGGGGSTTLLTVELDLPG